MEGEMESVLRELIRQREEASRGVSKEKIKCSSFFTNLAVFSLLGIFFVYVISEPTKIALWEKIIRIFS